MEAGRYTPNRLGAELQAQLAPQGTGGRVAAGLVRPVDNLLLQSGQMARFFGSALVATGGVWRYTAELMRQVGIIILGSALIIWGMEFVVGAQCATEGDYALRGFGASAYTGVFTAYCSVREMGPYMFGYIVAAKIGCGLVAELGSMRISEEIDAMSAVGINPMRYLVATRLVAAWLTFPLIYFIGLGFHFVANYLVIAVQLKDVSPGAWAAVHWAFQDPLDLVFSLTKVMVMGTAIVLVAMYYGWTARGGPVGVGHATAKSMVLNLVLIHVIGSVGTAAFWGFDANSPIGG